MKPLDPDLIRGEAGAGALAPVWSYGEALALASSHPPNGDPGSTQILTWHCGAQSQTVSLFESSETTPTSKFP
jgi:hypothetical protein